MADVETIKAQMRAAFVTAPRPPAGSLHTSEQSDEASTLLEADFAGRESWQHLDASFIDQAPDGFGTALSFFSDEAFRYFLPAYLIADLDGLLLQADPVFHLTHGLTNATRDLHLAGGLDGITWWQYRTGRLAAFVPAERAAIVAYLAHRVEGDEVARDDIEQSLANYWLDGSG